jgi:hypothetical protein
LPQQTGAKPRGVDFLQLNCLAAATAAVSQDFVCRQRADFVDEIRMDKD